MAELQGVERIRRANLVPYLEHLRGRTARPLRGRVVEANGQTIESEGPRCSVGESCEIVDQSGGRHLAEVIGFHGRHVVTMPLAATQGIRYGDSIVALGVSATVAVSDTLQGRILNALGRPLDGAGPVQGAKAWSLDGAVPHPLERVPITEPMQTGIRALDGMLTIGRGQRLGIFGGSGVGKSTLIGMMTRNTAADITVVGLVGERGREVREFVEDSLGEEGRRRSVVLVSTSDQSPLLRMRAAMSATSVAEYYAAQGKHVLLVLDSLTRYAMAAREIGLAAGEPPASKGYTPSVFTRLAKLVERAGNFEKGSITAFYTVLMEGDDQQDPIVDAVRSFLDGHVVLSRHIASAGQYPPVDVLDSLSRLMPAVTTREHRLQATKARKLLAAYARSEDLIRIGAYSAGADEELDRAIQAMPSLLRFLEQRSDESVTIEETIASLSSMSL
jgi:flagellum-specific ATP synthase